MNLEKISRKYNVSENFLQSKDDGLSIGVKSIDDLIIEIKKGTLHPQSSKDSLGIEFLTSKITNKEINNPALAVV
jgi:hypothetical protein